jgi:uncharacterized protein
MDRGSQIIEIVSSSKWRMGVLRLVEDLGLPDWWIGAGFVRNAVWDYLHEKPMTPLNDIDVIYFDPERPEPEIDGNLEIELQSRGPKKIWSVKNQARMHLKNGDEPYESSFDALRHWPETATALAVSLRDSDQVIVAAPHGVDDVFDLVIRPTTPDKADIARERAEKKRWLTKWPKLRLEL